MDTPEERELFHAVLILIDTHERKKLSNYLKQQIELLIEMNILDQKIFMQEAILARHTFDFTRLEQIP